MNLEAAAQERSVFVKFDTSAEELEREAMAQPKREGGKPERHEDV